MYSILFRVVADRDIYMYYKTYREDRELDEIYKSADINEISEKVKILMETGVALRDIKVVKDVDIDVILNISETENTVIEDTTTEDVTTEDTEQ